MNAPFAKTPAWNDARYAIARAAEEFLVAYYLPDGGIAAQLHIDWGIEALKRAIEAIGPEAIGYQRIDRLEQAAVICGIEPDRTGGRISDCLESEAGR